MNLLLKFAVRCNLDWLMKWLGFERCPKHGLWQNVKFRIKYSPYPVCVKCANEINAKFEVEPLC
jgi:hypothetical protein